MSKIGDPNSKDLISITFTKEQWEEIYQWYLIVKDDYALEHYEVKAGEAIAETLMNKYGSFK